MEINFHPATPILRVASLDASIAYFVDVLGFKVDWRAADLLASVGRGPCHLFLCEGDQGHPGTWVWIGVGDTAVLHDELSAKGALRQRPARRPALRRVARRRGRPLAAGARRGLTRAVPD